MNHRYFSKLKTSQVHLCPKSGTRSRLARPARGTCCPLVAMLKLNLMCGNKLGNPYFLDSFLQLIT